uniref:Uncharacterized protein n=1 Tax=viral metagenome TaxID=1070528 RepID=A0A6C0JIV8_9ZZZZ
MVQTRLTEAHENDALKAQIAALKQSFTTVHKTYRNNPIRLICYNELVIGLIINVFTVDFVYYYAPTMIRLFPYIFEAKYFPESLNFYIYRPTVNGKLSCEQLTLMLNELEHHKHIGSKILKKYTKKMN